MAATQDVSTRELVWANIIFFAVTTLCAVIGIPIYIAHFGLSLSEILFFFFMTAATGLSITAGYHRLFAHVTFKAHPVIRFFLLFFGAAAFEQSALKWAAQHREHHRYVDTDRDPYSIKKGFFYAHIGWLMFWRHPYREENIKDLLQDPMLVHQHRYYYLWSVGAGIITPLVIGALTGHLLGAFLLSVCGRLTFVYHATFCINSVCHMFGKATYDPDASAKDHWLVAILTYGEGYHNFHHRFPVDYRNGVRWYHWDPSKWLIALWARLGLAWQLKTTSAFRILAARLSAERQIMQSDLENLRPSPVKQRILQILSQRYQRLHRELSTWEATAHERRLALRDDVMRHSKEMRENAFERVRIAKFRFKTAYARWTKFRGYNKVVLHNLFLLRSAA